MARLRDLHRVSDRALLERLSGIATRRCAVEAELLAHIAEVDRRRLYEGEGYSSMFVYCVDALHLSEAAAGKRITAARVARRFPAIVEKLAANELHLAGICVLAPHLTEKNHRELLAQARHKSKRDIERLVASWFPRPDVRSHRAGGQGRHVDGGQPAVALRGAQSAYGAQAGARLERRARAPRDVRHAPRGARSPRICSRAAAASDAPPASNARGARDRNDPRICLCDPHRV